MSPMNLMLSLLVVYLYFLMFIGYFAYKLYGKLKDQRTTFGDYFDSSFFVHPVIIIGFAIVIVFFYGSVANVEFTGTFAEPVRNVTIEEFFLRNQT